MSRPAVFLDRDGTLNVRPAEHEYVSSARDFEWLPGAPEAVALLADSGYFVAVVSNQRGVALGLIAQETLGAIEDSIQQRLRALGCSIDAFSYCTHDLAEACLCRKPAPGQLLELAARHELDLTRSWMIGDDDVDVAAGRAAGCRTVRIGGEERAGDPEADFVVASLPEASRVVTRSLVP